MRGETNGPEQGHGVGTCSVCGAAIRSVEREQVEAVAPLAYVRESVVCANGHDVLRLTGAARDPARA
jgi:hypothetical protein